MEYTPIDSLNFLLNGLAIALQPQNLLFAFIGSMIGTLIGVLPGIGPCAGTAMLIPVTFVLPPIPAIIMLAAIYYGAMYGGTITSVLMNVPGESSSVPTCFEGHPMAKRGRAGPALAIAAIGSFFGGLVATMCLVLVALPMAKFALQFGPAELFALMFCGLSFVMSLAGTSITKSLLSALLGLAISLVGVDPISARPRFFFGHPELTGGVEMVPLVIGLFGIGEILYTLEGPAGEMVQQKIKGLMPSREDLRRSVAPALRGTVLGIVLGLIPGMGSNPPPFLSYAVEKRMVRNPKEGWGNGVIEAVAGPETANNAYANSALIPLFTLGIPASPTIAVMMGAFMINGLIPGPFLFTDHPDIAWGVIASLFIGNVILLVLNLPLIGMWVQFLRIPQGILFSIILGFCILGAYTMNSTTWDIGIMVVAGFLGYVMRKLDYPLAPMTLTIVLGPLIEKSLVTALMISRGDASVFLTHPISLGLLVVGLIVLITSSLSLPFGAAAVRKDVEA